MEMEQKSMRYQLLKLTKRNSTKAERRVVEILKEYRIPFRAKAKIGKLEVDFLIGNVALEIDGHKQDGEKNHKLVEAGYIPIHLTNEEVKDDNKLRNRLKQL